MDTPLTQREDLKTRADDAIRQFRGSIPDDTETARAIDRNASWTELSQIAEQDGYMELVELICLAERDEGQNESD
jgi:hypothetical protein